MLSDKNRLFSTARSQGSYTFSPKETSSIWSPFSSGQGSGRAGFARPPASDSHERDEELQLEDEEKLQFGFEVCLGVWEWRTRSCVEDEEAVRPEADEETHDDDLELTLDELKEVRSK
jgi:hypothetical protein